jgi:hypothetical protein
MYSTCVVAALSFVPCRHTPYAAPLLVPNIIRTSFAWPAPPRPGPQMSARRYLLF